MYIFSGVLSVFFSCFYHMCQFVFVLCVSLFVQVRALRDIAVGEEVCISYIAGVLHSARTCLLFLPTHFRAPHLHKLFGFACLCGRCGGREAHAVDSDLIACGVRDVAPDLPRDFVNHTTLSFRVGFVASVEQIIADGNDDAMAAAPLLPAVAAITMQPKWRVNMRACCVCVCFLQF